MSEGDAVALSGVDFLGLVINRRVVEVDLIQVGHAGLVYVRELSTSEKDHVMGRPKGKTMVRKGAVQLDWSQMPKGATERMMRACLVTDMTGEKQMYDVWLAELGQASKVMKSLADIPNSVADLIVGKCREISGMVSDDERNELAEKKDN